MALLLPFEVDGVFHCTAKIFVHSQKLRIRPRAQLVACDRRRLL